MPSTQRSDLVTSAPARLVETSADVRAAVLLDPAGGLIAASDDHKERARRLGDLAHEIIVAADAAANLPTEQVEARVDAGAVFAVRSARHTFACVVRRLALPSLILYDLRRALLDVEAADPA